jgi:hypothetical protein
MMRSKPIAGRHLGWSEADRATKPYARFLDPNIQALPDDIRHALDRGPLPEPLLPAHDAAAPSLFGQAAAIENGFALAADGAMMVAARTDLPGVTPAMIDWWFGWHSDSPDRYKFWHPLACTPRGSRRLRGEPAAARATSGTPRSSTSISAAR